MNVYLPDDLAEQVRAGLAEANISAICQAALRAELDRAQARAEIDAQGYQRIEAFEPEDEHDVAFQGKQIGGDINRGTTVYLTPKGALAVVGEGRASFNDLLAVYDNYREFEDSGQWSYAMMSQVADSLGEKIPVEELDI